MTVRAQDLQGRFSISPYAGISLPVGVMAENSVDQMEGDGSLYYKPRFKYGVSVDDFYTPILGAGLHFRYAKFNVRNVEYEGEIYPIDDKLSLLMFGVHTKFFLKPDGIIRLYGVLGGGLAMWTLKDWNYVENLEEEVDLELYFLFGCGVTYFVSPTVSVFGEFTLDYLLRDFAGFEIEIEEERIEDVTIYFNSHFINVMFGLTIWF